MPHLSIQNRSKIVSLYYEYELNNKKFSYGILKALAADLNIHVEESAIGGIMNTVKPRLFITLLIHPTR